MIDIALALFIFEPFPGNLVTKSFMISSIPCKRMFGKSRKAQVTIQAGAKKLFAQAKNRISDRLNRLVLIWVDAGYQGEGFMRWVMDTYHWVLQVVRRPVNTKGFVLLPKRWVVERSFGWFNWCRRLNKDYKILPQTHETFVQIAMIRLMLRGCLESIKKLN
jgi:transposase